ncbi:hypothetical protein Tco_1083417 [Tanacetum coccineum]
MHQLDTFYNALTPTDQDSLNAAADGNLLTKTPRDALTIIENKSKVRKSQNKTVVSKVSTNAPSSSTPYFLEIIAIADTVKAMLLQKSPPPTFVKAFEEICVTCGGPHPYHQCLATDGNDFLEYRDNIQGYVSAVAVNYNQGNIGYRPQIVANQIRPPSFAQPNLQNNQTRYNQGYNQNRGNNYNQGNLNYQAPIQQAQVGPLNDLLNYMKINDANMNAMQNQINNVKNELRNEMQTSMSNQTNELKNMMASFFQMNTASSSGSGSLPSSIVTNPRGDLKQSPPEVVFLMMDLQFHLFPMWWNGNPRTTRALIDVYGEESTLRVDDEAITFKYAQEVLGFLDSSMSGNPTPSLDPILSTSSPSFTPFEGGDFILEDLFLLEKLLNDDPSSPLPPKELHFEEIKMIKSSIDDPLEIKLKDLPSHLEYAFLEETDKLPVIIAKDLKDDEKDRLLKVLKSHKHAIA